MLIRREEDAAVALGKLKALGLTIALDDFGTGYSALTHLRHFPVDVIKIDRSFVDALVDEKGRAIVRGVISIAHGMGMRVVAEGVENLEQRAFLAQEGCVGIRIYGGVNETGHISPVIVGVLSSGANLAKGELAERAPPCPPECGELTDMLNQ